MEKRFTEGERYVIYETKGIAWFKGTVISRTEATVTFQLGDKANGYLFGYFDTEKWVPIRLRVNKGLSQQFGTEVLTGNAGTGIRRRHFTAYAE